MEPRESGIVPPRQDQILLKLNVTSVCASDPKIFAGQVPWIKFPLIMEHELVGQVIEIGDEAAGR
jgi:D-arabinose 1-dehydrogenase-like Zn-dependent alcohol dehydrogenase